MTSRMLAHSTTRRAKILLLVGLALLLIISGLIGIIYQRHVNSINATATATVRVLTKLPDPYTNSGTLMLYDLLQAHSTSNWHNQANNDFGGSCQFTDRTYHIKQTKLKRTYLCMANTTFYNFVFEVEMNLLQGDCGGIIFRADSSNGKNYQFRVCQSFYRFYIYKSDAGSNSQLLIGRAIFPLSGTNVIAVVADGSRMDLYINNQAVGSINDSNYNQGTVGLIASW